MLASTSVWNVKYTLYNKFRLARHHFTQYLPWFFKRNIAFSQHSFFEGVILDIYFMFRLLSCPLYVIYHMGGFLFDRFIMLYFLNFSGGKTMKIWERIRKLHRSLNVMYMKVFYSFRKKDIGCLVSSRITETYNDVVAGMFNIESNLVSVSVSRFLPV